MRKQEEDDGTCLCMIRKGSLSLFANLENMGLYIKLV